MITPNPMETQSPCPLPFTTGKDSGPSCCGNGSCGCSTVQPGGCGMCMPGNYSPLPGLNGWGNCMPTVHWS
jgi:hypothetical protein